MKNGHAIINNSILNKDTAVIVPTRSLANVLKEQYAQQQQDKGCTVWETPNIFVWQELLQQLWSANKVKLNASYSLITSQQSAVLWTSVIEQSRRNESNLTLLNVQQTTKAVMRSWKLLNDWQIELSQLDANSEANSLQFVDWSNQYKALLEQKGLIDTALLSNKLFNNECDIAYDKIIWLAYDLKTATQTKFDALATAQGISVEEISIESAVSEQQWSFTQYETSKDELKAVLTECRVLVEADENVHINVIVPDLHSRLSEVHEIAKSVFYPSLSPLEEINQSKVYRFSLGKPLDQYPTLNTALRCISLLKNHFSFNDINSLLRSEQLCFSKEHKVESQRLVRWLTAKKINTLSLDNLSTYLQYCRQDYDKKTGEWLDSGLQKKLQSLVEFHQVLREALLKNKYPTQAFSQWVFTFKHWLSLLGWGSLDENDEASYQYDYQIIESWNNLLDEYSKLEVVQSTAGLSRAVEIINQHCRDTVFLAKAPASPILISGVYEAIGQATEHSFVLGMNENYPEPAKRDAFITNSILAESDYPEATTGRSYVQAEKVQGSLLNSASKVHISYARNTNTNTDGQLNASSLYREQVFDAISTENKVDKVNDNLETYEDIQGSSWQQKTVTRGGSAIFENQSNCAFKAFVSHQLVIDRGAEPEFGLDSLERGIIVHFILQNAWQELQTQDELKKLIAQEKLEQFAKNIVQQSLNENSLELAQDKVTLLKHEKIRLTNLLIEWLHTDAKRPHNFAVLSVEDRQTGSIGGINFNYEIDRIEAGDDGRIVIVDYKTGAANRNEWLGERIEKPQLPLYALAHEALKQKQVSGIAYGKVKRHECGYSVLCEEEIFVATPSKTTKKNEDLWLESKQTWPKVFEQLASDFMAGRADVNPIKQDTCKYCEIKPMCRIAQLREQSDLISDTGEDV